MEYEIVKMETVITVKLDDGDVALIWDMIRDVYFPGDGIYDEWKKIYEESR